MAENTYIIRNGYDPEEQATRISASSFRTEDEEIIQDVLEESERDFQYLTDHEKEVFLETLRTDLGDSRYEQFLDEMFEKYGEKGDSFNLQFYSVGEIDYDALKQNAERAEGSLEEIDEDQFSLPTSLEQVIPNGSSEVIDLLFEVVGHPENVDVEDARKVKTSSGEYVDIDDLDVDGMDTVVTENKLRVEVRVYADDDIFVMSNTAMKSNVEDDIIAVIKRWVNDDV